PVHEGKEDMNAAAQDLGLEARLPVQRDETRADRALRRPHLLDDADLAVGYVAKDIRDADQDEQQDDDYRPDADRDDAVQDRIHDHRVHDRSPPPLEGHFRWNGRGLTTLSRSHGQISPLARVGTRGHRDR